MSRAYPDAFLTHGARLGALVTGSVVVLIVGFIGWEAWPALVSIGPWRLCLDPAWQPESRLYGMAPLIAGTGLTALAAVALGGPLGVASALFGRYYAPPPLGLIYRRVLELLAGVPSVVYGLWGLAVVVPWVASWAQPGTSLFSAALVLALMILPTVAITADTALAAIPQETIDGAVALGLGREAVLLRVQLPAACGGIGVGILLALGRALGETMAVLMVAGNVVQFPGSPFDPVRTVTGNLALEIGYATVEHRSVLFAGALGLILLIGTLVLAVELSRRGHHDGQS